MIASKIINIQPKRILVITLRFLGDTLLTTPLLSSLKQAYPAAKLDVLTFKANAAMLEGNPDLHQIITLDGKPNVRVFGQLLLSLYRRYDLAISTQASDRPTLFAIMAGKISLGFVPEELGKAWWKKWLLNHWLIFNIDYDHAVLENLRFCKPLGIKPCYKLTPPRSQASLPQLPAKPYAVLHIMPQWRYKEWHSEGWRQLIEFLGQRGLQIVFTGSGQASELKTLNEMQQQLAIPITNLAGQLSLGQLTALIGDAALFIGPDTGITHLAAATGTMTFALFGPTDPKKWAPWPSNYAADSSPFSSLGSKQIGNVYLIQGKTEQNCLPCQQEGCERHRKSYSDCLDRLPANLVIEIIRQHLTV